VSVNPTEATVSVLPNPTEAISPPRAALLNPAAISEFKIRPEAAERVEKALRRRVLGHRTTAAILMLAALIAIAGGIALIFYAGELAKVQRAADVEGLVERASELSRRADDIRKEAERKISDFSSIGLQRQIESDTRYLNDYQKKLSAEKDPDKIKGLQDQVDIYKSEIDHVNQALKNAPSEIQAIEKQRDADLAPVLDSEKQVNAQITGNSAFLEYNSILIRVAAVLLIVFLVQTFITIFRYMTRLAAYYQARIDSLQLAAGVDITIIDLQRITTVFSPETYDFGKLPRTPTEQAVDLARTLIASQRKEE
jgi:hypothetical protein